MKINILWILLLLAGNAVAQKNLIVNGGFEKDSLGFTSEYKYVPAGKLAYGPGEFYILTDASKLRYQWSATGMGKFMVVDGAEKGAPYFWKQTVKTNPKKNYLLKMSLSALYYSGNNNLTTIAIFVNERKIGFIFCPKFDHVWEESEILLPQPLSKITEIGLVVLNPAWGGNDFGIDNISLTEIKKDYKPKSLPQVTQRQQIERSRIDTPDDTMVSAINVEGIKEDVDYLPIIDFTSVKLKEEMVLVPEKDVELNITNGITGETLFSNVKAAAGTALKFDVSLKNPVTKIYLECYTATGGNLKVTVGEHSQIIELKVMQRRQIVIRR